ncbi:hypothetical protein TNCV_2163151 [Trichonephila clavipes]|nr:hypothetical protein TNCV_2163151 [Trichonephila clavipes]
MLTRHLSSHNYKPLKAGIVLLKITEQIPDFVNLILRRTPGVNHVHPPSPLHLSLKNLMMDPKIDLQKVFPGKFLKQNHLRGGFSGKKESGQLRFGCKERPFKKPILPHKSEKEHPYANSYSGRYHSRNKFSDRHGSHRRSKHYD